MIKQAVMKIKSKSIIKRNLSQTNSVIFNRTLFFSLSFQFQIHLKKRFFQPFYPLNLISCRFLKSVTLSVKTRRHFVLWLLPIHRFYLNSCHVSTRLSPALLYTLIKFTCCSLIFQYYIRSQSSDVLPFHYALWPA